MTFHANASYGENLHEISTLSSGKKTTEKCHEFAVC